MAILHAILLALLLPIGLDAQEWEPGKNLAPANVLQSAQRDARCGRYDQALAKHIWFHRNILKHEQAQYGVRLSFALAAWHELGEAHAPAMVAFKAERDRARAAVIAGENTRDWFHDFSSFNDYLNEPEKTVELFLSVDKKHPDVAKQLYDVVRSDLLVAKRYDICLRHTDAERDYKTIVAGYKQNLKYSQQSDFGHDFLNYTNKSLAHDAGNLIALLSAAGKLELAGQFASQFKELNDDKTFHAVIDQAISKKFPQPYP